MAVTTLIYAYLAICVSLIIFNTVCVFIFRRRDRISAANDSPFKKNVLEQLESIRNNDDLSEEDINYLKKKLRSKTARVSFDEVLEQELIRDSVNAEKYLNRVHYIFQYLSIYLYDKDYLDKAHLAYLINKYKVIRIDEDEMIINLMFSMIRSESLYCRENALKVIYGLGSVELVYRALTYMNEMKYYHNPRLLQEGLLTYSGSNEELAIELLRHRKEFSVEIQLTIINYVRFSTDKMREEIFEILENHNNEDDEIVFAAIRYFQRYQYWPAYEYILDWARDDKNLRFEYASISAQALGTYPGAETINVLKKLLSNNNWYVRYNAAQVLEKFHLPYYELSDIMDGNDRFAREIMQYQMDEANERNEVLNGYNQINS